MNINYQKTNLSLVYSINKLGFFIITFFMFTFSSNAQCVIANDCDGDGIVNSIDLDDDNDGILDTEECEVLIGVTPFAVSNGNSVNYSLNSVGNGFILDVTRMDNSFNLTINGTPLTTQEIQFQQNQTPTGQNIRFKDGSRWGVSGIPQIYQFGNAINPNTPIIRFVIDENLSVKMYGSKVANGPLFELELFNGNSFNAFSWNANSINNFILSQLVTGPTYINGRVYGTAINCDIDEDGFPNSQDLDSDGDGCFDVIESGGVDANNDGKLDGTGIDLNGKVTGGINGYNGVTSNEYLAHQLNVTTNPINQNVANGQSASFSVVAISESATSYNSGSPVYGTPGNANASISYQWYLGDPENGGIALTDSGLYSGTNSANLNISNSAGLSGSEYYIVVSNVDNICSSVTRNALLVINLPTAVDDTFDADENSPANTIDVLLNDTFGVDGPNLGTISLPLPTSANGGTITVDDGGTPNNPLDDTILYTPAANFTGTDTFQYTITDANGDVSTATVTVTVNTVYNCNQSPTAPAQGFNVFVEENLNVKESQTKGAMAVGNDLTIRGDYNVATDDCGDFDTNGLKTGLLVGNKVNYPLNTVINTTDNDCNCGDPTIVNNGSFEENVNPSTWVQKKQEDIPGWNTTSTDGRIEIWKSGFLSSPSQNGGFHAEINATQRAALYQVICAEPGSVLNWSIWHRGRAGVDVAEVKIGGSLNAATSVQTMSTGNTAWQNYTGSYTVPAGENKVYFVFQAISSSPFNNLSYGNLIDNFEVTKTTTDVCPPSGSINPNGLLTIVNPNYYAKIGNNAGSVAWYFDELSAPAPMRVTPNAVYNSSSRIQMTNNSPSFGVSSGNNPVYEANLLDFAGAFQSLRTNATNLSLNANNAVLEDNLGNSIPNTGLPNHTEIFLNNGVNYLNITGADLNSARIFEAQRVANADRILIINVDAAGTFNWDVWEQQGFAPADSPYVLYNFFNTTTLNIIGNQTIYGTVFAPFAEIEKSINKADIYGQVIAKSFIHEGGTIHCEKFAASTTCPPIVGVAPTSDFNINVNPQCFDANIFTFDNLTNTGGSVQPEAPITYLWDFGDGTTSTVMNPTKNYATPGNYSVSLTATNSYGVDIKTVMVEVLPVLQPIVTVETLPSIAGKIIKRFTVENAASFTEFSWTLPGIGPGMHVNHNPITYEFTEAGAFEVAVTATSADCTTTFIVPITITSNEVTTGNAGGVESESLGDAISKIYVNRKKNSIPTEFVKSEENLYNKAKLKQAQPYQGKGQTMLDMFPERLVAGDVANVTSPTDILDYTIADEVLSVDFSFDGKTKGVVLGIKTSDKVYNHTKASCDRLRGAEILTVKSVNLEGYNFLMQAIKQRNGVVEHAISFAVAKNNNDGNYSIQTNWYVNNYTKFNDMYNFQVWSTNPEDTQKLVKDILANLKSFIPVVQNEKHKTPKTFAAKIYREKSDLVVKLKSTQMGQNVEVTMDEMYSETTNNLKHRYNPISTELDQFLRIDIADGYEYDALIKVNGEVEDAFYHADGNWGLDFDSKYTKIEKYFVSNNFDREYKDDEYAINRNVEIKATSEYDYLTLYKSLLPGTLSADYTDYNYVSFTAKGSGLMELGLIKSSIEDWKKQYRLMVDVSNEEQTYYVPFEIFSSTGTQEKMVADDLTTLTFTFLPVEAQTKELDLTISDVKFVKVAGSNGIIVEKEETFENEFITYPNPSKGTVNLLLFSKTDSEAMVTLYDITGKTIYSAPTKLTIGKNELDFNFKVKTGIYFIKVVSSETNYGTSKILFR
ncbi:choice-of-anchor A family protein [Polaribacter sp. BAL334]|uniref:collagen-binding domain-containing protein n=1 Tax=Polaribacter sp. BAL334 TaxID=1708178 RepID=UPI0018D240E9|nr:collagen-binding domain-containing protein [Polaribacter sp. BAL334]MBG7612288.1 choice-of-anchor A family protein [Polaribacter sp. BAL334]